MSPTVKMKEKKQQSAEIRVQQEVVRQMQNATQGMNGANRDSGKNLPGQTFKGGFLFQRSPVG